MPLRRRLTFRAVVRVTNSRWPREAGVALTGPGGLLKAMTKTVIETALGEELSDHLGYTATTQPGMEAATPAT
jgi:transposase-like protein